MASCMQVSRLVVTEIVSRQNLQERVACIEKWAAIADICRCMHNYNGVLQICAAFVNSSVYRLKKTWEKLSKQVCCGFQTDGNLTYLLLEGSQTICLLIKNIFIITDNI